MRIPPHYEEMIREIKTIASRHGFLFHHDELTDYSPPWTGRGHHFDVRVLLKRQSNDFMEDAFISVSEEASANNAGN